jgi:uncharacterized protein YjiS (DUF1127 family)
MRITNISNTAPFGAISIYRMISTASDVFNWFRTFAERETTANQLHALSDAQLRDIGLERKDIRRAVDNMLLK